MVVSHSSRLVFCLRDFRFESSISIARQSKRSMKVHCIIFGVGSLLRVHALDLACSTNGSRCDRGVFDLARISVAQTALCAVNAELELDLDHKSHEILSILIEPF